MDVFGRLFKPKCGSEAYRLRMARELHGQAIRYVTERKNDNDDVVGRGGALCLKDGTFIVDSSGDRIFACPAGALDASYLMSGDGVILTGPDALHGGGMRTVTAYFVYHRK